MRFFVVMNKTLGVIPGPSDSEGFARIPE